MWEATGKVASRPALKRARLHLRTKSSEQRGSACSPIESGGCFRSSEGLSQVIPRWGGLSRLILLLFGGVPNSPRVADIVHRYASHRKAA